MSGAMGRKRVQEQLVGIRLLPDTYVPEFVNTEQLNNGKIIGVMCVPIDGTTCSCLRKFISMFLDAPKDYCFLNSNGWPITYTFEDKIPLSQCLVSGVVTIQEKHGRLSRVGVKLFSGEVIGFIFISFTYEISRIRNAIISELGDKFETNETFEFIDNNSWPVTQNQENRLSVWNLIVDNCILIIKKSFKRNMHFEDVKPDKRLKSFKKPANLEIVNKVEQLNSHSILISYVHQEASIYARDLKKELLKMGFKRIFLDIDDIPAGQDWQDVISLAVNNCTIFVPLVTPRYGETRWTNREAKLADDREKIIIPVSFLNKWPPDQLAIQFVTLQYIPWKTNEELNGGNFSGHSDSVWNQKSVIRVAKEIKKLCSEPEVSTPDSVSLLDGNVKSPQFTLKLGEKHRNRLNGIEEKKFIVISAHVKQRDFVEKVTKMLEADGYNVWSSMNMCDCDEISFSPLEDTQPFLTHSPLMESNGLCSAEPSFDEKSYIENSSNSVKSLKKIFKDKVKEAKLVVLIFSEDYLKSRICWQQLYYIEQRKKAIVIKLGTFPIDSMIQNLYPEHEMITKENWECLKFKIKDKLKFDNEISYRSNIMLSVSNLRNVVDTNLAVYIIGGTTKISKKAQSFCMTLGNILAKVKHLNLATEGFFGVGDLVGKNFCEEREIRNKGQPSNVYHIIPTEDAADYSHKALQTPDGKFEKLPYGNTLYYGMSVSNRDDIVAAAFKLCILIEGGERSACLAEKFLWNEGTVIPVLYNNSTILNTIENKQCLKQSLKEVPNGVNENDWKNLNRSGCSVEDQAVSVKKIVCTLLDLKS